MGFKKKLYKYRPKDPPQQIEVKISQASKAARDADPVSIERGVRQMLADKVMGDLAGIWLLVAEHLRLGTWDLLCGWTGKSTENIEPRLALQMVHEAAVCTAGIRGERTLHKRGGFELANGLPFVATDTAVHHLLNSHTIEECQGLQVTLGKLRHASGHFQGKLLAIDPHRVASHSKRQMRERVEKKGQRASKKAQTFWVLDADTCQPVCFTTATASRTVAKATPPLLEMASQILPQPANALVLADGEHFSAELLAETHQKTGFHMLVPIPNRKEYRKQYASIAPEDFCPRWAGFATLKRPYELKSHNNRRGSASCWQFIERFGERADEWSFKGFLSTTDTDEVDALTEDFPKRWHVEEFFNAQQALGWKRAGTMNLNIRYGQMSLALVAQTVVHQLRKNLGAPYENWDANHLARDVFFALEGDVRVNHDTIVVTYYNAPNADRLRRLYENLPDKLRQNHIPDAIPWLYNYKLDFRFR